MSKIKIVPFQREHVNMFSPREAIEGERNYAAMISLGPSFSAEVDGRIIGCAGIVRLWNGVGEAWAILGDDFYKHRFSLHKIVKRFVKDAMIGMKLHRLQAYAIASSERNCSWLKRLGFDDDVPLPGFGPGQEDYKLFSIVRKTNG